MRQSIFCAVVALLLLPALAFTPATGNLQVHTKVVNENMIKVQLYNLQQARTSIELTDMTQRVTYFSAHISKHNGFSRILDLSDLPDGRYIIKVRSGDASMKQVMKIQDGQILLSEFSE